MIFFAYLCVCILDVTAILFFLDLNLLAIAISKCNQILYISLVYSKFLNSHKHLVFKYIYILNYFV